MTVTTRHPESRYGFPVVLDEEGQVLDPHIALRFFRRYYGLSTVEFSRMCNASTSQLTGWESRHRSVPLNVFNVMRDYLEDEKAKVMRGELKLVNGKLRTGLNLVKKRIYSDDFQSL